VRCLDRFLRFDNERVEHAPRFLAFRDHKLGLAAMPLVFSVGVVRICEGQRTFKMPATKLMAIRR
jgi:hypothetical protein